MAYFKIGNTDYSSYVKSMKVGYETILSEDSGRNANGDNVVDIVNRKYKLYITFIPMPATAMKNLMQSISDFVVSVSFLNPRTETITTINAYTGTPNPEYYFILDDRTLMKDLTLDFIEM